MTFQTFEIARMRLETERKLMSERYARYGRLLADARENVNQDGVVVRERPAHRLGRARPAWQALMRALVHSTQLGGT
jgi:hypothetical protein